jgi:hypothetical protein
MGTTINLGEWWDTYKAAKSALANTLTPANIKSVAVKNGEQLQVRQRAVSYSIRREFLAAVSCRSSGSSTTKFKGSSWKTLPVKFEGMLVEEVFSRISLGKFMRRDAL